MSEQESASTMCVTTKSLVPRELAQAAAQYVLRWRGWKHCRLWDLRADPEI